MTRSYKRWSPNEELRLRDDYLDGRSLPWLAEKYGRSLHAVEKELQRIGARRSPVKAPPLTSGKRPTESWGKDRFDVEGHARLVAILQPRGGESLKQAIVRILDEERARWDTLEPNEREAELDVYKAGYMKRYRAEHPGYSGIPKAPVVYAVAPDNDGHPTLPLEAPAPPADPATPEATTRPAFALMPEVTAPKQQRCRGCRVVLLPGTKSGLCAMCRTGTSTRQGLVW